MEGNFLEYAASKLGIDVGFGKMILIYPAKTTKKVANLTASAINAEIVAGTIMGVIKGWHTIAGAPVAEINVERTATAEMKLIRAEIGADTLTFESNMANAEVLADLVKAGSLNCILIDDQGNAFGDYSQDAGEISTMLLNFSNKTTSTFQRDNVTEKMISVTVRYLVKELDVLVAGTETELVEVKTLLVGQFVSRGATSVVLKIREKYTNEIPAAINNINLTIPNNDADDAVYVPSTGLLTINFTSISTDVMYITLSSDDAYMKTTKIVLTP